MLFALKVVCIVVTLCVTSSTGNDVIDRNTEPSNTRLAANRPLPQRSPTKVTRDGQLLSLLAARRRLVIEDRFRNHIRNIVEITTRQNITNTVPRLEATFPNSTRTLNLHLNLSDLLHNTVSNHSDESLVKTPSTASNAVSVSSPRSVYKTRKHVSNHHEPAPQVQENKTSAKNMPIIRNILFRRKHSYLNRKLPLDFEQITFDTLGISEINKNPDDLLLDNEDSLQVEESSHDKLIYYEKNNASKKSGNTFEDTSDETKGIAMNNKTFHNSNRNNNSKETKVKPMADVKNITANESDENKFDSDEIIVVFNTTEPNINVTTDSDVYVAAKIANKTVLKNNTRYLSPSLYSYFRPLDVPEEEMQPFLRFGEKLSNNHFNTSRNQSVDKEEDNREIEEEVHENMDVSVVKPRYENKIPKLNMPNQKTSVAREYYKHRMKSVETNLTSTSVAPKVEKKVVVFSQSQRNATRNRGFRNSTIFFLDRMKGLRKTIHLAANSTIADLKPTLATSSTTEATNQVTTNATDSKTGKISRLKLPSDAKNGTEKLSKVKESVSIVTEVKIKSDMTNTAEELKPTIPIRPSTEQMPNITSVSTEENLTAIPSTTGSIEKTTVKTINVTKRIDSLLPNPLVPNQTIDQSDGNLQNKIRTTNTPPIQLHGPITNETSTSSTTTEAAERKPLELVQDETTTVKTSSTSQNPKLKFSESTNSTSKVTTTEASNIKIASVTQILTTLKLSQTTETPQTQVFKSNDLSKTDRETLTTSVFETTTPTNPTTRIFSTAVVTSVSVESSKLKSDNKSVEVTAEKSNDSMPVETTTTTAEVNDPFATMIAALSNFTLQAFQNNTNMNPTRHPNGKLDIPHVNLSHHTRTPYSRANRTKFILKSNSVINISTTSSTTDFIIHVPDIEIVVTTELTPTETLNTIANTTPMDDDQITSTLNYDYTTDQQDMTPAKPNETTSESSSTDVTTKLPTKIFNTTSLTSSESELPLATLFNIIKKPELDLNVTMHKIPETVISRKSDGDISLDNVHAAYILAALGFLPMMVIVIYVVRTVLKKKHKMIEDFEAELHDSEKKTIIFPVARLPALVLDSSNRWEFPRNKLRLQTLLGQGNFGQVWKAEADDLKGHVGLTRLVAVKTIKDGAGSKERDELLKELAIMQKMGSHPNVVTLLGCCTDKEPYLLIMEYVMYGKLLTFLRDHRTRRDYYNFSDDAATLTARDLTVFAYCVARGMEYLSSKGIIHRDLAARNVLVDHNKLCKIADFGMSRDAPAGEVTEPRQPRNALPVRWMAIESLLYSLFTHKSDVWSFGVLLWEIVTLGSSPYANMSGREVMRLVCDGYRLERPNHCKPELYRVMARTWLTDPAQRPTFTDLRTELADMLDNTNAEGSYVDLESFRADSTVYEIDNCTPRGNYFTVKSRFSEFECEI